MNPITITIEPPITEYCNNCDYKASESFYIIRAECPKCGHRYLKFGPKLTKKPTSVIKTKGKYAVNSDEEMFKYIFLDVPDEKGMYSFVLYEDIDILDPFEPLSVAKEIDNTVKSYLFFSKNDELQHMIKLLESPQVQEYNARLLASYKFCKLKFDLYKILYENPWLMKDKKDNY